MSKKPEVARPAGRPEPVKAAEASPESSEFTTISFPPRVLATVLLVASSVRHDMSAIRQLCHCQTEDGRWSVLWSPGSPTLRVYLEQDPHEQMRFTRLLEEARSRTMKERPGISAQEASKNPARARKVLEAAKKWDAEELPKVKAQIEELQTKVNAMSTIQDWTIDLAPLAACERLTIRFKTPVSETARTEETAA